MRASCGWVRWLRNVPLAAVSIHWRSHSKPRAVTRTRDRGMPRADFTGYTNSALTETCVSNRLPRTAPPRRPPWRTPRGVRRRKVCHVLFRPAEEEARMRTREQGEKRRPGVGARARRAVTGSEEQNEDMASP